MTYQEFINSKRHLTGSFGFEPLYVPDCAFDFQAEIIERAVRKGRYAVFADTGLGKTLIQLSIAVNIVKHTGGRVLIITPLAVGFQFVKEAEALDITNDIEQTRDGSFTKSIVVCNYERLHLLDSSDFEGVILDESSILKNFKGSTKSAITAFMKKVKYRFLSTATPAPNDFMELGTSSEALGHMGYMDMMGRFFANNSNGMDSNAGSKAGVKYYLKPHAESDFFAWINTWACMVRKPSDLGPFSDDRYKLPPLIENTHVVKNTSTIDVDGQVQMFNIAARTFQEIRHEVKSTVSERCEKAVELASGKTSVYWVNRNDESERIAELDQTAVEIRGSMTTDQKEDVLVNFANGEIPRIITKAKMTGMGLNWQHCQHSVFFPTWSYEQYYQALRRFHRFGQTGQVCIDLVVSDGQTRVLSILKEKARKAEELYEKITDSVNASYEEQTKTEVQISKPKFL